VKQLCSLEEVIMEYNNILFFLDDESQQLEVLEENEQEEVEHNVGDVVEEHLSTMREEIKEKIFKKEIKRRRDGLTLVKVNHQVPHLKKTPRLMKK
jgi:hypothetical protein